jgi:hypothetical protein
VGVDVDEARRHHQAAGSISRSAGAELRADGGDPAVLHGDIGHAARAPEPSITVPFRMTRSNMAEG